MALCASCCYLCCQGRTRPTTPAQEPCDLFYRLLVAFVSANAWLAYLTLFLAALLEAVPVMGSVIPGSTIILALSAMVPGGELQLPWVLAAAVAGAVLGDGSAFWVGHAASAKSSRPGRWRIIPGARTERSILQSLGRAGGVFRPLRAADPRFCPDYRRRARHAADAVLRGQYSGDPAMGAGPCAARRARGIAARKLRPFRPSSAAPRSITGCRWWSAAP